MTVAQKVHEYGSGGNTMSAGLHAARPKINPLRRLMLGVLVLALSALGLSTATPASAAMSELKGTGPEKASITLSTGLYQVSLRYTNNSETGSPALFTALLDSKSEQVVEYFALDRKNEWSAIKVVQLFEKTKLTFDVMDAAANAEWALTFEKTYLPPKEAQTKFSWRNWGLSSSPMVTLKAATYQVTTTFKDNVYAEGLEEIQKYGLAIMLYGYSDKDHVVVDTTKRAGTVIRTIKIAKTGAYWINPVLAPTDALWSVKMVALKSLTKTPTPKISGTTKVGKKLKAKAGPWKPSGVKLSYQWYRGSSKIPGATKSSYKLTSKDKGKKLKVRVTGSKSGYLSVGKTSKSTATIRR